MTDQRRESAAPGEADVAAALPPVTDEYVLSSLVGADSLAIKWPREKRLELVVSTAIKLVERARRDAGAAMRAEDASLARHYAVFGDPRGKSHEYDKGWSDACFAVAAAIRVLPAPGETR